jgi:Na+/alanine symporter
MLEEIYRVFIFPKSDVNNAIFECSVGSPVILLTSHYNITHTIEEINIMKEALEKLTSVQKKVVIKKAMTLTVFSNR